MTTQISRVVGGQIVDAQDLQSALAELRKLDLAGEEPVFITTNVRECLRALQMVGTSVSIQEIEREHIRRVLKAHKDNKNQAAKTLGIDRTTLYNKLKKYQLH